MGSMSIWHWVLVLVVVALLFGGRGKLSGLMGDAAKGIKAFKEGLKDDEKDDKKDDKTASSGGALPSEKARERDEVSN